MYESWKKRTRREITLPGTGEEVPTDRPRPNFRSSSLTLSVSFSMFLSWPFPPLVRFNANVPRELRSVDEIRKLHNKKNESNLKNMKKGKRKVIEGKMRKQKNEERKSGFLGTKAGNRKVRAVFRR
jgi:hypothetical protein